MFQLGSQLFSKYPDSPGHLICCHQLDIALGTCGVGVKLVRAPPVQGGARVGWLGGKWCSLPIASPQLSFVLRILVCFSAHPLCWGLP